MGKRGRGRGRGWVVATLMESRRVEGTLMESRRVEGTLMESGRVEETLTESRQVVETLMESRRVVETLTESRRVAGMDQQAPMHTATMLATHMEAQRNTASKHRLHANNNNSRHTPNNNP